ncbi:MAG: cysteine hydrolase family protein [Alphaproteobacteria bacterium]|nr:cysteine hydrolase family protein [Alphaproteobacteria bacterium]
MSKKLTLNLIDFQNDFVAPNGALTFDNGKGDLALIARAENFFNEMPKNAFSYGIITYDTHYKNTYNQTEESKTFPLHCEKGTIGWLLAVNKGNLTTKIRAIQHLRKSTYDMWAASIDPVYEPIIQNTDEVVLCGVASDICNKAALLGWVQRDIPVTILTDLTRGIFKETDEVLKEKPFKQAVAKGQIKTTTSLQFLKNLKQHQRG